MILIAYTKKEISQWQEYYDLGFSIRETAKKFKVSSSTISRYIKTRDPLEGTNNRIYKCKYSKEEINSWQDYYDIKHSAKAVSNKYNISVTTVYKYINTNKDFLGMPKIYNNEDYYKWQEYYDQGHTLEETAAFFSISKNTLRKCILTRKNNKESKIISNFIKDNNIIDSPDQIRMDKRTPLDWPPGLILPEDIGIFKLSDKDADEVDKTIDVLGAATMQNIEKFPISFQAMFQSKYFKVLELCPDNFKVTGFTYAGGCSGVKCRMGLMVGFLETLYRCEEVDIAINQDPNLVDSIAQKVIDVKQIYNLPEYLDKYKSICIVCDNIIDLVPKIHYLRKYKKQGLIKVYNIFRPNMEDL